MGMQCFYASTERPERWPNGAVGYRPEGPYDCLGPFAKVTNCPIHGTELRRTVYATGYADTWFSIPAHCMVAGKRITGYLTTDNDMGGVHFRAHTGELPTEVLTVHSTATQE